MFAGDLGAGNGGPTNFMTPLIILFSLHLAWGMIMMRISFLIHIDEISKVTFEMIAIKGDDIKGLGKLEDRQVPGILLNQ